MCENDFSYEGKAFLVGPKELFQALEEELVGEVKAAGFCIPACDIRGNDEEILLTARKKEVRKQRIVLPKVDQSTTLRIPYFYIKEILNAQKKPIWQSKNYNP